MATLKTKWHFFIVYAKQDHEAALRLYEQLTKSSDVFLDIKSLQLGDDWDMVLPTEQRASLITVVLISSKTSKAYYQREEIAAAIELARKGEGHRVVPVYLDADAINLATVPYGLKLKHGITLANDITADHVAQALYELRIKLSQRKSVRPETISNKLGYSVQCPMCGLSDVDRIESVSVESFDAVSAGWAIGGSITLHYCAHNKCRNCGTVFDDIAHAIPVQYPSLRCPECDEAQFLRCRVRQIKKARQVFTFQAILCCTHCGRAKFVQEELGPLWSVETITVSSRGVSLTTPLQKSCCVA